MCVVRCCDEEEEEEEEDYWGVIINKRSYTATVGPLVLLIRPCILQLHRASSGGLIRPSGGSHRNYQYPYVSSPFDALVDSYFSIQQVQLNTKSTKNVLYGD
jgi:hypothetical protein